MEQRPTRHCTRAARLSESCPKPEFGLDDLLAEGLLAARQAWPRFNPQAAPASTFVYIVAARRLIELQRHFWRDRMRERNYAAKNREMQSEPSHQHEPADLADWLRMTARMIRRNLDVSGMKDISVRDRANGLSITRANAGALLALKKRMNETDEGMIGLLSFRPDLVSALGLTSPPPITLMEAIKKSFLRINLGRASN